MTLDRDAAWALLTTHTKSESLIVHALSVEAAMRWYCHHFGETEHELWGITGLLHDFDYEQFPDPVAPNGHPYAGNRILEEYGYPESLREAIMGHADYTGVPRTSLLAKALYAVDELSGLITAASLVRPDRSMRNLEVSSIKKKFKDKAFARGCNRDDIRRGAEELGVELETHMGNVLAALQGLEAARQQGERPGVR